MTQAAWIGFYTCNNTLAPVVKGQTTVQRFHSAIDCGKENLWDELATFQENSCVFLGGETLYPSFVTCDAHYTYFYTCKDFACNSCSGVPATKVKNNECVTDSDGITAMYTCSV
eukprot:Phypoly_transcript_17961.p1 GENE.Phypoly_transcript_17961~~Phypoly_transcript_17961.p1  ORF type:complete len:114 (+),score=19.82 Phypoly_transcript_17961:404-745(+)